MEEQSLYSSHDSWNETRSLVQELADGSLDEVERG